MPPNNPDVFTEVTHTSWLSRIKSAIGGIVVGLVLFLVAFPVLFWNEGRAVKTARSLDEGAAVVRSVAAERIDPTNDAALVHLSGEATTGEILEDAMFGVALEALRIERTVQMFQWREERESSTEKKMGGGTETVTRYSYSTEWASQRIDSSRFRKPDGHGNPRDMRFAGEPLSSHRAQAKNVNLGAFRLSSAQVARIGGGRALALDGAFMQRLPSAVRRTAKPSGGWLYLGGNADAPMVGDLRVRWTAVLPGTVSVIAKQRGEGLVPYPTGQDRAIELVETGAVPAAQMFQQAQARNSILTWALRAVGVVLMIVGIALVLAPLAVLADVIPALGTVVGMGTGLVASLLGVGLSLITIAVAWVFHRPLLGIVLLLAGAGALAALLMMGRRRRAPAYRNTPPHAHPLRDASAAHA